MEVLFGDSQRRYIFDIVELHTYSVLQDFHRLLELSIPSAVLAPVFLKPGVIAEHTANNNPLIAILHIDRYKIRSH